MWLASVFLRQEPLNYMEHSPSTTSVSRCYWHRLSEFTELTAVSIKVFTSLIDFIVYFTKVRVGCFGVGLIAVSVSCLKSLCLNNKTYCFVSPWKGNASSLLSENSWHEDSSSSAYPICFVESLTAPLSDKDYYSHSKGGNSICCSLWLIPEPVLLSEDK